ncbi:MAG: response regulator, partial [Peptococcaceae bacterium]|nr:response regulator [Peptococcaceae bacterium]
MTSFKATQGANSGNDNEARILIVDDEKRIREMIREYIGSHGYVIEEAADGLEALTLYSKLEYSLIILDVMMPGLDGWSLVKEI